MQVNLYFIIDIKSPYGFYVFELIFHSAYQQQGTVPFLQLSQSFMFVCEFSVITTPRQTHTHTQVCVSCSRLHHNLCLLPGISWGASLGTDYWTLAGPSLEAYILSAPNLNKSPFFLRFNFQVGALGLKETQTHWSQRGESGVPACKYACLWMEGLAYVCIGRGWLSWWWCLSVPP